MVLGDNATERLQWVFIYLLLIGDGLIVMVVVSGDMVMGLVAFLAVAGGAAVVLTHLIGVVVVLFK